ncbi:ATP-binding protein [Thermoleptolyngbya sp. C42_A2020_037]|uniref:ATP-binding protein n=1 Tax=Thermoleptolyngbya sp. C42_A2020_037 TaxID=2747799 RepID=UPI001A09A8E8|nr:ATP-binding protein [Thermoleptolyngbya sp. C42_A2020_037]MBF2085375.1 GAF domain-containing protein [Thermoleptolyngbya sp. C42_A2020_037]
MTLSEDSSSSVVGPTDVAIARRPGGPLQKPPSIGDLIFIQDAVGTYLSFSWKDADRYGLGSTELVGRPIEEVEFAPAALAPYLQRIRMVLDLGSPDGFSYLFCCGGQYLVFDLALSPILQVNALPSAVIVTGHLLYACTDDQAHLLLESPPRFSTLRGSGSIFYQKALTRVAWNIRHTLDLDAIWQQTASGLGETLNLSRCWVCAYPAEEGKAQIMADYRQDGVVDCVGQTLDLPHFPYLQQAVSTLQPVSTTQIDEESGREMAILAIATCHDGQPNGLLVLYQDDEAQVWRQSEIELVQEFAEQIGTGLAHASLYATSRRQAERLMQQYHDLEESRRQAEEASRLKSEFLANTSHELRTPLNGMIGFLKLIVDGMADDPEEQGEFIEEAYRSAVNLNDIINDILDIAKIEAGKLEIEINPVKLDDLMDDVERFIRPQAEHKHLSFKICKPETRDPIILNGNYQRLRQVLLNLLGNAIKFTHEGGITVTTDILPRQSDQDKGYAKISVADTGIGVSLEKQDRLFQSFSQVDGSRTRQYGGTGLGLAISQKLVEAMKGEVNFYSLGEGLGSTVTFTVPLHQHPVLVARQSEEEDVNLADLAYLTDLDPDLDEME